MAKKKAPAKLKVQPWIKAVGNKIKFRRELVNKFEMKYAFFASWHRLTYGMDAAIPPRRTFYSITTAKDPGATWTTFYTLSSLLARCFQFPNEMCFADVADNLSAIPLEFHDKPILPLQALRTNTSYECQIFDELTCELQKCFDYCKSRFTHQKSHTSSTSIHFFGAGFDFKNAKSVPSAGVLAIGTELDHLEVALTKRPKEKNEAVIADEIVDLIWEGFILAIANKLDWDEEWMKQLRNGYEDKESQFETWVGLQRLHSELRLHLFNCPSPHEVRDRIKSWMHLLFRELGGFMNAFDVTFYSLLDDLKVRMSKTQQRKRSHSTRTRVGFPSCGIYVPISIVFSDKPGVYAQIIEYFANAAFDIWAARSKLIVPGESAVVELLARLEYVETDSSTTALKESILKQRMQRVVDQLPFLETRKSNCRGGKLVTSINLLSEPVFWEVQLQSEFYREVSKALINFNKLKESLFV